MGQLKRNDFVVELDKKGRYKRTLLPPQPSFAPHTEIINGKRVIFPGRFDVAPKGYNQPHKANGNNEEVALFGAHYAQRYRHDKRKRRNRVH